MKFKAKTRDYQLIVRAKASFGEEFIEHEIEMFASKNIRGFMRPHKVRKGVIEYSGPIAISLAERLNKSVTAYDFFIIIEQLIEAVRKIQSNNFVVSRMALDLKNIYINETTKEVQFIYLPLVNSNRQSNITELLYSIVYTARPETGKDSEQISRFAYFIKGMPGYNADKIEKYIESYDKGIVDLIKNVPNSQSGFITNKREDYYKHYDKKTEVNDRLDDTVPLSAIKQSDGKIEDTMPLVEEYEETTPLVEDEEATGLLFDNHIMNRSVKYPEICRMSTGEIVKVNKPVYRIGKERSYVDFFIANNTKISRSHVDIIRRGDRYYVKDLGSKNKSYINGVRVLPELETEIFSGDILRLADEEFTFKI